MKPTPLPVTPGDLSNGVFARWSYDAGGVVSFVIQRSERETPPFGGSKLMYVCSRHAMGCRCIEAVKLHYPEKPVSPTEPSTKPAA